MNWMGGTKNRLKSKKTDPSLVQQHFFAQQRQTQQQIFNDQQLIDNSNMLEYDTDMLAATTSSNMKSTHCQHLHSSSHYQKQHPSQIPKNNNYKPSSSNDASSDDNYPQNGNINASHPHIRSSNSISNEVNNSDSIHQHTSISSNSQNTPVSFTSLLEPFPTSTSSSSTNNFLNLRACAKTNPIFDNTNSQSTPTKAKLAKTNSNSNPPSNVNPILTQLPLPNVQPSYRQPNTPHKTIRSHNRNHCQQQRQHQIPRIPFFKPPRSSSRNNPNSTSKLSSRYLHSKKRERKSKKPLVSLDIKRLNIATKVCNNIVNPLAITGDNNLNSHDAQYDQIEQQTLFLSNQQKIAKRVNSCPGNQFLRYSMKNKPIEFGVRPLFSGIPAKHEHIQDENDHPNSFSDNSQIKSNEQFQLYSNDTKNFLSLDQLNNQNTSKTQPPVKTFQIEQTNQNILHSNQHDQDLLSFSSPQFDHQNTSKTEYGFQTQTLPSLAHSSHLDITKKCLNHSSNMTNLYPTQPQWENFPQSNYQNQPNQYYYNPYNPTLQQGPMDVNNNYNNFTNQINPSFTQRAPLTPLQLWQPPNITQFNGTASPSYQHEPIFQRAYDQPFTQQNPSSSFFDTAFYYPQDIKPGIQVYPNQPARFNNIANNQNNNFNGTSNLSSEIMPISYNNMNQFHSDWILPQNVTWSSHTAHPDPSSTPFGGTDLYDQQVVPSNQYLHRQQQCQINPLNFRQPIFSPTSNYNLANNFDPHQDPAFLSPGVIFRP